MPSTSLGLPAAVLSPSDDTTRLVFKFITTGKRVNVLCKTSTPESPVQPGGGTWGELGFRKADFQSGHEIVRSTPSNQLSVRNISITFPNAFLGPTKVLVWLTHINYKTGPLSLSVSVVDPSITWFNLSINVDKKSIVQDIGVAWVAYPASRNDIASGFQSSKRDKSALFQHSGTATMRLQKVFGVMAFVGVNALDMEASEMFTMEANSDNISGGETRMNLGWTISVWPKDACLHSAGISYLLTG